MTTEVSTRMRMEDRGRIGRAVGNALGNSGESHVVVLGFPGGLAWDAGVSANGTLGKGC